MYFKNEHFSRRSFKEISQVKNKLLTADWKKSYYEKKWIFLIKRTKFEVSMIFLN